MPLTSATRYMELTLAVISSRFDKFPGSRTITIETVRGLGEGNWSVTLQRAANNLTVVATWHRPDTTEKTFLNFKSMHIVPRSNFFNPVATTMLEWQLYESRCSGTASFPAEKVLAADQYNFDVVFSSTFELSRSFASIPNTASTPTAISNSETKSVYKERGLISLLLKDPSSVDVCFTFISDKTYSNIGLWAHRCVLSQYDSFSRRIQEAKALQSLGEMVLTEKVAGGDADVDSDVESISTFSLNSMDTATGPAATGSSFDTASRAPLVIKVNTVSLATFCVMLYYIYTGEVDRTVHPNRFVLSNTNKVSLVWRNSAGEVEDSVVWHPLNQNSPWRLKDVAWRELKEAAVHYGLKGLETLAELRLQSDK
ncbi:hypothetical protein BGZ96_000854 [Linnemannia gamsii]|uniref:BTB domain-containing protein n=1 Tax=Linnemannia gamsii TaxID=64522 RepID=A0ABQ7JND5_9FUNG|nr:hypothetical protein BGZ96_000854 [Linnemannia gamsii]